MAKPQRRRNPAAKLQAIHAHAIALMSAKGYDGVTMAEIAQAAELAVGTIYRFYPNKTALLLGISNVLEEDFVGAMQRAWSQGLSYDLRLQALVRALFDLIAAKRNEIVVLSLAQGLFLEQGKLPGATIREEIARLYEDGIANGGFSPHDSASFAAIAHGMVDGAMRKWLQQPSAQHRLDLEEMLTGMLQRNAGL